MVMAEVATEFGLMVRTQVNPMQKQKTQHSKVALLFPDIVPNNCIFQI